MDLISHMVSQMDARLADEGRSFLTKAGGGTRLGEKLVDERVHLYSDPMNAEVPGSAWAPDNRPRERVDWIKDGVVSNLAYSRYWAEKKGVPPDKAVPGIGGGFRSSGARSAASRARRASSWTAARPASRN